MPTPEELPAEFGRYRILQKLGQGGMGAVYLAEDTRLGRRVALKVPHFTPEDGPKVIERFYREARVAAAIEHPNICPVYDIGEVGGIHYLTMPFIDGRPLSHKADAGRPLPTREAANLVRQLALAVGVMHEQGLIHRDLKPGNVLMRPNGDPVVMDFGLARSYSGTGRLTATGAIVGTPAYMSPEQIVGRQSELGPPTDVYSLGVILFELVTGQLPFVGPLQSVYGQILHAPPPTPSTLQPGLDREMDAICLKALAKDTADRYAGMADLAAALTAYVGAAEGAAPRAKAATVGSHASGGKAPPRAGTPGGPPPAPGAGKATCPSCGKSLKLPATALGKRVRCPACSTAFSATAAAGRPPTAPPRDGVETGRQEEAHVETRDWQDGPAAPEQWYYIQGGQVHGPVPRGRLVELVQSGELDGSTDLVWAEGMPAWSSARSVAGLLKGSSPPPPPRSATIPPRPTSHAPSARGPGSLLAIAFTVLAPAGLVAMILGIVLVANSSSSSSRWDPDYYGKGNGGTRYEYRTNSALVGFGTLFLVLGAVAEVTAVVLFLVWLYQAWGVVPAEYGGPSPGMAVGLLFVPLFNLYWAFRVIPGLSTALGRLQRDRAPDDPHGAGFGVGLAALLLAPWLGVFSLLLFAVWINLANRAKNRVIQLGTARAA